MNDIHEMSSIDDAIFMQRKSGLHGLQCVDKGCLCKLSVSLLYIQEILNWIQKRKKK